MKKKKIFIYCTIHKARKEKKKFIVCQLEIFHLKFVREKHLSFSSNLKKNFFYTTIFLFYILRETFFFFLYLLFSTKNFYSSKVNTSRPICKASYYYIETQKKYKKKLFKLF